MIKIVKTVDVKILDEKKRGLAALFLKTKKIPTSVAVQPLWW